MTKAWAVFLAVAVLVVAWAGALWGRSSGGFATHMAVHLAVVAIAAPLLAVGLGGSRWDPTDRWPLVFAPIPASVFEMVVVWGWHAPALHHLARASAALWILEQASFLAAGLLLWLSAFGGSRLSAPRRAPAGMLALLVTSMHMTLLGTLLALSPRPLYGHAGSLHGLSVIEDQHLGGTLMLLVGGASYLAGGLVLAARLLRDPARMP